MVSKSRTSANIEVWVVRHQVPFILGNIANAGKHAQTLQAHGVYAVYTIYTVTTG